MVKKMKTYRLKNRIFKLLLLVLSVVELNLTEWIKKEAHKIRFLVIKNIRVFMNPYGRFPVFVRYFYRSRKFRSSFFYFHNQMWEKAIKEIESIPEKHRDLKLLNMLAKSQQYLGLHQDSLQTKEELLLKYTDNLSTSDSVDLEFYKVLKPGSSQLDIQVGTKDSIVQSITKTVSFNIRSSDRGVESHFYQYVFNASTSLSQYVPELINYFASKSTGQLTIEHINGRKPQLKDLDQILSFQKELFSIRYKTIRANKYLKNVAPYITTSKFMMPHNGYFDLQLALTNLSKKLSEDQSVQDAVSDLNFLKRILTNPWIENFIDLREELVVQHLDFGSHNMMIDQNNILKVYDWETYNLSIPGIDILRFIFAFTIDFELVKTTLYAFLYTFNFKSYHAITAYLTYLYLEHLANQTEGVRIQENWNLAIDYLRKSPLNH